MEENKNIDTPEGTVPQNEQTGNQGSDGNFSFNEVIFGDQEGQADASTNLGGVPETSSPVEGQKQPDTGQPYQAKNDEKRFEYWQSKAAKLEAEVEKMKPVVNQASVQAQINQALANQPQAQAQPQQDQEFPAPPEKPKRPVGYTREQSYTDPNSASAQYDDALENWRDNMDEYNQLRSQYTEAVVAEQYEKIENARRAEHNRVQNARKIAGDKAKVAQYVEANYGLSKEESSDFINKYSNPSSITVDNLVALYNIQRGQGGGAPVQNNQTPENTIKDMSVQGPSGDFVQTQRAQQIPQPMGVMPSGQNPNAQASESDQAKGFMQDLINFNDEKQPF